MRKIQKIELYKLDARPFIKPLTKEIAYLLGFLYADGYIFENIKAKSVTIRLEIKKEDYDDIKDIINKTGYWPLYTRKREGRKEQATISTSNRHLYNFLFKYHYRDRKCARNILKLIPKNLRQFWYRGFLDGDGSIYINNKLSISQLTFAGKYEQSWNFIKDLLKDLNIIRYKEINIIRHIKSKYSVIRITNKKDIKKLLNYIYKNNNEIGLRRKYNKYLEMNAKCDGRNHYKQKLLGDIK